jgi:hypothetical protein
LRIAPRGRGDKLLQGLEQAGLRDRCCLAAAAEAAHPTGRHIFGSTLEFFQATVDRAPRKAGDMRHRRDTASPRSPRLAGRPQPQAALVEMASHRLIAHTNGAAVDHFPNI